MIKIHWRIEVDFRLLEGTLTTSAPALRDLEHIADAMPSDFTVLWELIREMSHVDLDVLFMQLAMCASMYPGPDRGNLSGGPVSVPRWLASRYTSCVL